MAQTTFAAGTVIASTWLNDIDSSAYSAVYNVKLAPYGAVGDGVTDDTVAIQAVFTAINALQVAETTAQRLKHVAVYFPQGNYKITAAIKVHGFVSIIGVGTAYNGGSVMHQMTASTNIFEFYGSAYDNTSLGTVVQGMNYEFDSSLGTSNGYALYYPGTNDVGGATLNSNSHYIRNNRFGGWHAKGKFLYMFNCNDVEITGNTIDVCASNAMVFGDQTVSGPSDVRITQNNFFSVFTAITIYSGNNFTVHGNCYSTQNNLAGWSALRLISSTGTITANKITGITITGNSFWHQYNCLTVDGSASNVVYANNVHHQCYNYPILTTLASNYNRYHITGNIFQLDATYPNTVAPISFTGGGLMVDSVIADNTVDANGVNAVINFLNDNTTTSWLSTGMVYKNNIIKNNTSYPGCNKTYIPISTKELILENTYATTAAAYVTSQNILSFNTLAIGDYFTFDLAWEVVVNKTAVNASVRTGFTKISVAKIGAAAPANDVTVSSSVAQDNAGLGGTSLPTVTWAVAGTAPVTLQLTVTCAGIAAPVDTTVKVRAFNFRAGTGAPLVKCV